jgi:hypothetical protein
MAQTPQSIIRAAYSDSARAFSARAPSIGGGGEGKAKACGTCGTVCSEATGYQFKPATVVGVQPTAVAEVYCVKTPQRSGY